MSDERLRRLERRWMKSEVVDDQIPYLQTKVQLGLLKQDQLRLAAYCGNEAACRLLAGQEQDLAEWQNKLANILHTEYSQALNRLPAELHCAVHTVIESEVTDWVANFICWGPEVCKRIALAAISQIVSLAYKFSNPWIDPQTGVQDPGWGPWSENFSNPVNHLRKTANFLHCPSDDNYNKGLGYEDWDDDEYSESTLVRAVHSMKYAVLLTDSFHDPESVWITNSQSDAFYDTDEGSKGYAQWWACKHTANSVAYAIRGAAEIESGLSDPCFGTPEPLYSQEELKWRKRIIRAVCDSLSSWALGDGDPAIENFNKEVQKESLS